MSKKVFILLNILYFAFDYLCIPYINPDGVLFGFIPFQLFLYAIMGVVASVLWGSYFLRFFEGQTQYDEDEE